METQKKRLGNLLPIFRGEVSRKRLVRLFSYQKCTRLRKSPKFEQHVEQNRFKIFVTFFKWQWNCYQETNLCFIWIFAKSKFWEMFSKLSIIPTCWWIEKGTVFIWSLERFGIISSGKHIKVGDHKGVVDFLNRTQTKLLVTRVRNHAFQKSVDFDFLLFSHCQCEFDKNCPYLVLLECIRKQVPNEKKLNDIDSSRLRYIDQHFVSFSHSTDFHTKQRKTKQFHLTEMTRSLIHPNGINMGSCALTNHKIAFSYRGRQRK